MATLIKGNLHFGLLAIALVSLNAFLALGLSTPRMPIGNEVILNPEKDWTPVADASSNASMPAKVLTIVEAASRPVFAAERRPPAPTVTAEVELPLPPLPQPRTLDWNIAGVSVNGQFKRALFVKLGANAEEWHSVGEALDGWNISDIDGNKVVLQSGSETLIRYLYQPSP